MIREEASEKDDRRDNLKLKDGDLVTFLHSTIADWWHVPAGTVGVVKHARCVRVTKPKGSRANYFANVVVRTPDGGIAIARVPHSAISTK